MRDYAELVNNLRKMQSTEYCAIASATDFPAIQIALDAADAIEELLAFAKFVAREAIDTGDNDGVSAEILCRKLNKLGLIETDGEFWMLPAPPKEDMHD